MTYDIFKEKEAEGEKEGGAEEGEGGEGEKEGEVEKQDEEEPNLFIKDVVREPRMKFFEVPRLGCYLAVPLNYENSEFESAFDTGLKNHLQCEEEREKQREMREEWEEEEKKKREEY